jgi:hypothetical protein
MDFLGPAEVKCSCSRHLPRRLGSIGDPTRAAVFASPNSSALTAIMKCSAEG